MPKAESKKVTRSTPHNLIKKITQLKKEREELRKVLIDTAVLFKEIHDGTLKKDEDLLSNEVDFWMCFTETFRNFSDTNWSKKEGSSWWTLDEQTPEMHNRLLELITEVRHKLEQRSTKMIDNDPITNGQIIKALKETNFDPSEASALLLYASGKGKEKTVVK